MYKAKLILIITILAFTAITFIHPLYPREQFLQHAGTVLLLIPLIADLVAVNGTDSEAFKTKAIPDGTYALAKSAGYHQKNHERSR